MASAGASASASNGHVAIDASDPEILLNVAKNDGFNSYEEWVRDAVIRSQTYANMRYALLYNKLNQPRDLYSIIRPLSYLGLHRFVKNTILFISDNADGALNTEQKNAMLNKIHNILPNITYDVNLYLAHTLTSQLVNDGTPEEEELNILLRRVEIDQLIMIIILFLQKINTAIDMAKRSGNVDEENDLDYVKSSVSTQLEQIMREHIAFGRVKPFDLIEKAKRNTEFVEFIKKAQYGAVLVGTRKHTDKGGASVKMGYGGNMLKDIEKFMQKYDGVKPKTSRHTRKNKSSKKGSSKSRRNRH